MILRGASDVCYCQLFFMVPTCSVSNIVEFFDEIDSSTFSYRASLMNDSVYDGTYVKNVRGRVSAVCWRFWEC